MLRNCICIKGAVVVGLIAAITPAVWAQSPQEQETDAPRSTIEATTARGAVLPGNGSPGIRIDAPPTQTGGGVLTWFTNQADFEAFVASQGKVLKGIEDFEEAVLNPGQGVGVDDPLVSGVANPPVFPVGLTGLPNLQVQSNFEHDLFNPNNPRGADGLAAWSGPGGNFVTEVIVANFFVDSLDLTFLSEKTAVGFNPVNFAKAGAMEVNVFSPANELLGEMATNSDPAGTNFLGVFSEVPIGRINLFDVNDGAEGADRIQAWEAAGICGDPDAGNCFEPNGTPGCNNLDCCEAVCALDPFCCDVEWDGQCAGEALELCGNPVCPGEGSCFEANGTPGCDDPVCCNKVCTFDPFCCDIEWDGQCANEAADLCVLPPKNPCPWDIDGDGNVGASDLLFLLFTFGPCDDCNDCAADFDGNCIVGASDLLAMLFNWGPCPDNTACANPGVCGDFELCGVGDPFDCLCWTLFDGSGICLQDFFCADVEPCEGGDCPPGFVCVVLSCCDGDWCVPIIPCDDGAAPGQPKGSGPTGSGRFIEASPSAPTRPARLENN